LFYNDSWITKLPKFRPPPSAENYKPKPAYSAIAQAFAEPPPRLSHAEIGILLSTHNDFALTFRNYCSFMT
jgi:hypothetical protein